MDFGFSAAEERLRGEARAWLAEHVVGEFAALGGPLHEGFSDRLQWERLLGEGGWLGLAWPRGYGGRELSITEELVFLEEYARAHAPQRIGHFGDQLLAPTLIAHGTHEQRDRFLPPIRRGEVMWCQGFSEPDAGSDLAGVTTRAQLDGNVWRIDGQKVWTSRAQYAEWVFVLCRSDPGSMRHHGLSFLLVPLDQPGIEVREIRDITGASHFCELFFDGAVTDADLVVGAPGDGWKVAMTTLAAERGLGFLPRQLAFADALDDVFAVIAERGLGDDPVVRQRAAHSYTDTRLLALGGYRLVSAIAAGREAGALGPLSKLAWSEAHQRFSELAVDVCGAHGMLAAGDVVDDATETFGRLLLSTRAETIYAGTSQVMRNLIGERHLHLPR